MIDMVGDVSGATASASHTGHPLLPAAACKLSVPVIDAVVLFHENAATTSSSFCQLYMMSSRLQPILWYILP